MNRRSFLRLAFAFALLGLTARPFAAAAPAPARPENPPLLLLISFDAFRWDYCALHPDETPHFHELMRTGVSARGLVPCYPTNTFVNHYSIVTGLYPSHHGIVNNRFFDPVSGKVFDAHDAAAVQDSRWWGGEPIWVTAAKAGLVSATSFWVGSEAAIEGHHPDFWRPYDEKITFAERLAEFTRWLALPSSQRPAVIAFYFEKANSVGHHQGPDSPELAATLRQLDAELGQLLERVKTAGLHANVVLVSDHGMTPISPQRVIFLDDFLDPATVLVDFDGPVAGLRPRQGDVETLIHALAPLRHAKAYRVENLPARFHITANPRNPPVWIVPEEGWEIYFRSTFARFKRFNQGDHGYDPAFTSMHGILIANGPSFRSDGAVIDRVENVHLYNLLCAALHLTPAPNDGDDRLVHAMLANGGAVPPPRN